MTQFSRLFAAIAALWCLTSCGGSTTPALSTNAPAAALRGTNFPSASALAPRKAKTWGTGASGYFYGGNGGKAESVFFAYCDTTIYLQPTSSGCFEQIPYKYGKASMHAAYHATYPCVAGSQGYGTCTGALSMTTRLGKMAIKTALSVAGKSTDAAYVWDESEQTSGFSDVVTVTSSTLPSGTPVTLRETVELVGSYDFNCKKLAIQRYAEYGMRGDYASVFGYCGKQTLLEPAVKRSITAKDSVRFFSGIGASFAIDPSLEADISVSDCTQPTSSGAGCEAWGGSYAVSLGISKAIYHLVPVTPNVTLVSASGRSYQ